MDKQFKKALAEAYKYANLTAQKPWKLTQFEVARVVRESAGEMPSIKLQELSKKVFEQVSRLDESLMAEIDLAIEETFRNGGNEQDAVSGIFTEYSIPLSLAKDLVEQWMIEHPGEFQDDPRFQTESAGLYGPFTVTINTGERPTSRTKTKKFKREDDAILWAEDWLEDFPQYVFATAEVTDPAGNVVWTTNESVAEGVEVVDHDSDLDQRVFTLNVDGKRVSFTYWDYENNFEDVDAREIAIQVEEQLPTLNPDQKKQVVSAVFTALKQGVMESSNPNAKIQKQIEKIDAQIEAAKGRLGMARDRRVMAAQRGKGSGRIESSAETRIRGKIDALNQKKYDLKSQLSTTENFSGAIAEKEMTPAREKERERIVKGMKKSKADLKDRYGDDWENVMYATATKRALGEVFPYDVDHMPGPVHKDHDMVTDNVKVSNYNDWIRAVDSINQRIYDDESDYISYSDKKIVQANDVVWAKWNNKTQTGWFNSKGRAVKAFNEETLSELHSNTLRSYADKRMASFDRTKGITRGSKEHKQWQMAQKAYDQAAKKSQVPSQAREGIGDDRIAAITYSNHKAWQEACRAVAPNCQFFPSSYDHEEPYMQQAVDWSSDNNTIIGDWKKGKGVIYAFESKTFNEAKGLGTKVKIVKGPADAVGKVGSVGEIRKGAYKGAPKELTIDYTDDYGRNVSIQLMSNQVRIVKDASVQESLGDLVKRFKRGREADRKSGEEWAKASDAEKRGDKAAADKHFRRHTKYHNLTSPNQWTTVKEDDVTKDDTDIDKQIEFHQLGLANAQYKGPMAAMHRKKLRALMAKKKQALAQPSTVKEDDQDPGTIMINKAAYSKVHPKNIGRFKQDAREYVDAHQHSPWRTVWAGLLALAHAYSGETVNEGKIATLKAKGAN